MEVTVTEQNAGLTIRVRDHGPGVLPEHLAQLGEPFFRAPNQSGAGHGLGLAIARRAVERLGGHLRLDNHPEGGFIATLELPAALKA
ncbi:Sensor protein QseC [compost metagenome]